MASTQMCLGILFELVFDCSPLPLASTGSVFGGYSKEYSPPAVGAYLLFDESAASHFNLPPSSTNLSDNTRRVWVSDPATAFNDPFAQKGSGSL